MEKVICIVSGGMDSVTMLYWAKQKYEVEVINFCYGSKHNEKERPFARYHSEKLKVPYREISLDFIEKFFKSDLLKSGGEIPEGHYNNDSMKQTVVPFRNGIMLAIAVGYAESCGAKKVMLGSHKGDATTYPDCREEFTKAMSEAARLGTYEAIEVISPFNNLFKQDIAKIGSQIGIEYEKTWSCYKGEDIHCGKCGTCVERKEAFALAGIEDKTAYKS